MSHAKQSKQTLSWSKHRAIRGRKADPHESELSRKQRDAQGVVTIDSSFGQIHTTAPETLPKPAEQTFAIGKRVRHTRFGLEEIRDVHGTNALVNFPKDGEKRLVVSALQSTG